MSNHQVAALHVAAFCIASFLYCGSNNYPQPEHSQQAANRALLAAAKAGDAERVQAALQSGAEVDVIDEGEHYADTALMIAAREGYLEVARRLTAAKADTNHREGGERGSGETALMYATKRGDKNFAKVLLDAGADINIVSNTGATALSFARMYGHEEMVEFLLKEGANPDR